MPYNLSTIGYDNQKNLEVYVRWLLNKSFSKMAKIGKKIEKILSFEMHLLPQFPSDQDFFFHFVERRRLVKVKVIFREFFKFFLRELNKY